MIARIRAALAVSLALACASAPPAEPRAECPATRPRGAPEPLIGVAGDAQRGAALFASVCTGCHSAEPGKRAPNAPRSTPRLDCPEWLAATSDAYLYDAINRGPGIWGHGDLPPLGERLTPEQIADLVAYLGTLGGRR